MQTVREASNESEDVIKTEMYIKTEEDGSENSYEGESDSVKKSSKGSSRSNQKQDKKKGGGIRLNVNVGAHNIEIADKYRKMDETQPKNEIKSPLQSESQ